MRTQKMKHIAFRMHRRNGGFTLIEALIALLALSIGLLGIAALQMNGLRTNMSAAWRSQSTYLTYDIIDRIRANRTNRQLYAVALGVTPAVSAATVDVDLNAWKTNLQNTLPAGDGAIVVDGVDNTIVTVTVQWDDSKGAGLPLSFTTRTRL
jgi:type IV pilus assembly protein PilV